VTDATDGSASGLVADLESFLARPEVRRRLVHVGGAVLPLAYVVDVVTWSQIRLIYVAGLVVAVVLEFVRLVLGVEWWLFDELARDYERANVAGYALYVVGSTVAVLVFEPRIAVPALLMLAVVDPVSGLLADNEFREPKRPTVLAVAFALSGLIASPFVPLPSALLGAAATTLADGMTPVVRGHAIDDNLTILIGAAVAMWVGLQIPF